MKIKSISTSNGHKIEFVNLLRPKLNKLYEDSFSNQQNILSDLGILKTSGGEFAYADLMHDKQGRVVFCGARTIGVPARVVCQEISSEHLRILIN